MARAGREHQLPVAVIVERVRRFGLAGPERGRARDFAGPAGVRGPRVLDANALAAVTVDLWDLAQLPSCNACRSARIARLARMNVTGRTELPITCTACA